MANSPTMMIEQCKSADELGWLELRSKLWPYRSSGEHLAEMNKLVSGHNQFVQFLARSKENRTVGFIEASLRSDHVNGTDSSPVVFIEGLFVDPSFRRNGFARGLVQKVVTWANSKGCSEIASDTDMNNKVSHKVHEALGFKETERVVYFKKCIGE